MKTNARTLATALGLVATLYGAAAAAAWKQDASFGTNGVKLLAPYPGASLSLVASAADPQGRIVSVGTIVQGGQRDLLAMRFLADGATDPSFGFGGSVTIDTGATDEAALAVAVQGDGAIVIAGSRGRGALLLRLTVAGALDSRYGTNGFMVPAFMSFSGAKLVDVTLDSQGRVIALGTVYGENGAATVNAFTLRALQDGTLDRSYDIDGVRVLREFQAMAAALIVEPGDRTVVVGYSGTEYRLAALTTAGTLDRGFGSGGLSSSAVGAAAIATDLVAWRGGYLVSGLNGAALVRFNAAGFRDAGFGNAGVLRSSVPVDAWGLSALPDGTLGVVGSCRAGAGAGWYLGTLAADAVALVTTSCETVASGSTVAVVRSLQASTTRLLAVGHRYDASGAKAALMRYTAQSATTTVAPAAPLNPNCKNPNYKRLHPAICR